MQESPQAQHYKRNSSLSQADSSQRQGYITAVRGNVVDAYFKPPLPARRQALCIDGDSPLMLEVQTHVDANTVRCIALATTRIYF